MQAVKEEMMQPEGEMEMGDSEGQIIHLVQQAEGTPAKRMIISGGLGEAAGRQQFVQVVRAPQGASPTRLHQVALRQPGAGAGAGAALMALNTNTAMQYSGHGQQAFMQQQPQQFHFQQVPPQQAKRKPVQSSKAASTPASAATSISATGSIMPSTTATKDCSTFK